MLLHRYENCAAAGRSARTAPCHAYPFLPRPCPAAASGGAKRADYLPTAQEVWWKPDEQGGLKVVVKAAFAEEAVVKAGAPRALWTEIR